MEQKNSNRKRRFCEHCKDYVSLSVYFRHKKFARQGNGREDDDITSSDSESDAGFGK